MKFLVTGAAGFIGSYLVPALLERHDEVVALDLAPEPASLSGLGPGLTYVRADLGSPEDPYRAMLAHRPHSIFHLGSLLAGPCDENPVLGFKVNFNSTLNLLDAAAQIGVKRFVMTSSIAVFGKDVPEPVADDAAKNPANIYGQTKLACEHLLRWYVEKKGLDCRALRFTWVFGPGRTTGITALYSSLLLDQVALGQAVDVPNPEETGDWLYVRDAVKALLLAHDATTAPRLIYNIAGGAHAIREALTLAKGFMPRADITFQPGGKVFSPYPAAYDDTPARQDLGWSPDYDLARAVREHLETVSARARTANK